MMRVFFSLVSTVVLVTVFVQPAAAQAGDASAALRARLGANAELSRDERARLIDAAARAMAGKVARLQDGLLTHALDDKTRARIFAILTGRLPVDDGGLRTAAGSTMRGLRAPATPAQSEVDATETLWIDIETLLPRRFEFTYSMPGFGDAAFDLTFEK
jgi:hypothetical protein